MARISVGTVTPVPKGDYSPTATYNRLNWVKYNGALYCCKANGVVGVSPENTEFWMKQLDTPTDADGVSYDNSASGLEATKVQGAIDEVVADLGESSTALNSKLELAKAELQILGWNVPEGMPVKNTLSNGVLTQNVGRVDLGSLNFVYNSWYWVADLIGSKAVSSNSEVANIYIYGYNTVSFDYAYNHRSELNISLRETTPTQFACTDRSTTYPPTGCLYYELATPITHTVPDTEGVSAFAKRNVRANLLKPTLASTTAIGVTCTNNGDGTYTLNGTATDIYSFKLQYINTVKDKSLKLIGCPKDRATNNFHLEAFKGGVYGVADTGDGAIFTPPTSDLYTLAIVVQPGAAFSNTIFKPMLTTDLTATYYDFIPYTGDTGTLNGDVAELAKKEWKLVKSIVGTATITLPSEYEEIFVKQEYNNNVFSTIIPKIALSTSEKRYHHGGYWSSGTYYGTVFDATTSYISQDNFYSGGDNKTSEATITVYYR